MFTGIVEEVGVIEDIIKGPKEYKLIIKASLVLEDVKLGDSISTNGVCLTVVDIGEDFFIADVMKETIKSSNLSELGKRSKVNLERALSLNTRLGGHIVTGHIDGVGKIINKHRDGNSVLFSIAAEDKILKYIVHKGSVALDGVSLTIAYVDDEIFKVSVIPHTEEETTILNKNVGDTINIETDIIGKYVEKLFIKKDDDKESSIDIKFLEENGFI